MPRRPRLARRPPGVRSGAVCRSAAGTGGSATQRSHPSGGGRPRSTPPGCPSASDSAPRACRPWPPGSADLELRLEAVEGRHGAALTPDDLESAGRVLGVAQGRPDRPDPPWLSRGFLRAYSTSRPADWALLDDDRAWDLPLMRAHVGPDLRRGLVDLHRNRARLLDLMERLRGPSATSTSGRTTSSPGPAARSSSSTGPSWATAPSERTSATSCPTRSSTRSSPMSCSASSTRGCLSPTWRAARGRLRGRRATGPAGDLRAGGQVRLADRALPGQRRRRRPSRLRPRVDG